MKTRNVVLVILICLAIAVLQISSNVNHAQAGASELTVTSGLPNQGGMNPLAGATVAILNESFESILRKSHAFDGQPSVLKAWHSACVNRSPLCRKSLEQVEEFVVANRQMDATGRTKLTGIPAGSYYLTSFGLSVQSAAGLVWDLKIDLKPGPNSITLSQANVASFDILAARREAQPAAKSNQPAGSQPCRATDTPRPAPSASQANSTLSIKGGGYVYTYTKTNRQTGAVEDSFTERGNFSNTTLYLLDEDAETVFQQAGIKPVLFPVRLSLIESVGFFDAFTEVKNVPGMEMMVGLLGGSKKDLELPEAKAEFDCAMTAIRAHSVAQMTTNAYATGVFPRVPAGTYYLYGRFYRIQHPFRGGGMVWNLPVVVKPGQNTLTLTVSNAAIK